MNPKKKIQILSQEEIKHQKIGSRITISSGVDPDGSTTFYAPCPDGKTQVWCKGLYVRPIIQTFGDEEYVMGLVCLQPNGEEVSTPLCDPPASGSGSGSGSGSSSGSGTDSGFASTPDEACIGKPEGQMCFWTENGSTQIGKCVKKNDYGSKTTCKPY